MDAREARRWAQKRDDEQCAKISKMVDKWILMCIKKEMKAKDPKWRRYYWEKEKALRALKRKWVETDIVIEISDEDEKLPELNREDAEGEQEEESVEEIE